MTLFWTEEWTVRSHRNRDGGNEIDVPTRLTIDSDWVRPTDFPDLDGDVSIDVETKDPDLGNTGAKWAWAGADAYVCGVAVAWGGGKRYYPLQHEPGGNMDDPVQVWRWLEFQLRKPTVRMIGANVAYDVGWIETELMRLAGRSIDPIVELPTDIQGAAALLNEHRLSYSLDNLSKAELGRGKNDRLMMRAAEEFGFRNAKENIHRLPPMYVGPYAEEDAGLALELWGRYEPLLASSGLTDLFTLEREVLRVVIDMRRKGVPVSIDAIEQGIARCRVEEENARVVIRNYTNLEVEPWEALTLERVLREEGVEVPRTQKGAPSITKPWLIQQGSPVCLAILDLRKWNKLRTTFFEGHLGRYAHNGKIHTEFNTLRREDEQGSGWGTVTGRLSSNAPNLQQIPHRDDESASIIRSAFTPEHDEWWVADYASQEPRLTVHFAALLERTHPEQITGALEMVQKFHDNPRLDLHRETGERMSIERAPAKIINLGITYGMMAKKLCWSLNLPTERITTRDGRQIEVAGTEGKRLLEQHRVAVPFMSQLFDAVEGRAKSIGQVRTILRRICRFNEAPEGGYYGTYKALNKLIQGSAADQMKKAMVLMAREGIDLRLQVHDEVDIFADQHDAEKARQIMEESVPLLLPVRVDLSRGSSWGDVVKVIDART